MSDRTQDFIEHIKSAGSEGYTLKIEGGNTKSFLGRQTAGSNRLLSTQDHCGIISYEPVELMMQARSGTTIKEIEAVLAENGQCLPSEPARFKGKATIGGTLASNISGPARAYSGSLRDHILGVSLINGLGQNLKFGGQVMKNVAGYDISRLQAGAMGVMGLMTDISFKVMPKYRYDLTHEYPCEIPRALDICNEVSRSEKPITAASWFDGKLYLRFSTMESAIKKAIANCPGSEMNSNHASEFWSQLRDFELSYFELKKDEQILRISVASSAPHPANISGSWGLDWGGSLRWLKVKTHDLDNEALKDWSNRYGGDFYIWSGGKANEDNHINVSESVQRLNLNLKKAFDPHGLLNPGRLYSWM